MFVKKLIGKAGITIGTTLLLGTLCAFPANALTLSYNKDTVQVDAGKSQTLTVNASDTVGAVSYDWYYYDDNSNKVSVGKSSSFTFTANPDTPWQYLCRVEDEEDYGKAHFYVKVFNNLKLTYTEDVDVKALSTNTLSVQVSANDKTGIAYKWWYYDDDWKEITLGTNATYTFSASTTTPNSIHCTVTDRYGNYETANFHVDIENDFAVTEEVTGAAEPGETITMKAAVSAVDTSHVQYQWSKWDSVNSKEKDITGATSSTYTFIAGDKGDYSSYTCTVTDGYDHTKYGYFSFWIYDHDYEGEVTKEATCAENGVTTYTCKNCGKTYTEAIPMLSHIYDGGKITKEPTYTKTGVYTYTCSRCGDTKIETIPMLQVGTGTQVKVGSLKYTVVSTGASISNRSVYVVGSVKKKATVTKVVIPDTVKIGTLKYRVVGIDSNAFKKFTKLRTVVIGKNVRYIGEKAFYGCKALKKITIKSKALAGVGRYAIKSINKKTVIKVPSAKKRAYKKLFTKQAGFTSTMKIK